MKYYISKGRRFRVKEKRAPIYTFLPLIICAGLIIFLSSMNGKSLPDIDKFHMDKAAHLAEYLVFAYLGMRTIARFLPTIGLAPNLIITILCITLFGAYDEIYQLLIPNRTCSFYDFMFDFLGAGIGALIYTFRADARDEHIEDDDRSNLRSA